MEVPFGNGYGEPEPVTPVKGVPSSIEAERAVLGALMIDPDAIIKVANFLRAADFYRERHGWIYDAMLTLNERHEPLDFVTLVEELERTGKLEEIGGPTYLSDLISSTPTAIYVDHYARIVERTAVLRRLISAAGQIAELAYDESQDVDEVVDRAEQIVFGVTESRIHRDLMPVRAIIGDVVERIDFLTRNRDALMGVPTGFTKLDEILGGLQKSDLIILAARPGMGKSSLALSVGLNAARSSKARIAVFSLEMSNEQVVQRLLSMETAIDSHRLRLGHVYEDEWPILVEAANQLAATPFFIDDTPAATVTDVRTKARRLYAENGLDLIIIDYMQLMSGSTGVRNENRQQEISYISRSLKSLARELNVPVIALSQLSRAVEARSDKKPLLSDLRESGCLTGDTRIFLPDEGIYVPIRELAGQSGLRVLSLDTESWKLGRAEVSHAFCTGRKPVFRLTTRLGRTIRATANHPFLTIDGWRRLDELRPGQHIAAPRALPSPTPPTMTDAELALLGHLLGDGCTLPRHALQYTTTDLALAEMVARLAQEAFPGELAVRIVQERQWYQVYLAASARLTHGKRNPIAAWLDRLGVFGLRSHEKRVASAVFQQPAAGIATFLRHLWAADGCIRMVGGKKPRRAIFYASSSVQLARDVQSLLLRLDVSARLARVPQGDKGRPQYHVIVSGQSDVETFARCVGAVDVQRQRSLTEIAGWQSGRVANTNRDVIPSAAWRLHAVPAMAREHLTSRQLQAGLGMAYCGTTLYQQNLSRERTARVAAVVHSEPLQRLAQSDVYWDRIVSIEADGVEDVYDLTVPGPHCFVADDILVHNSIEQDADVVLFIYREDYYVEDSDRQNVAEVIVAKHRHGSTGNVSLFFQKELTQFRDLEIQRTNLDY